MTASISRPPEDAVVWRPQESVIDRANVTRLMRRHRIETAAEIRQRSLDIEWFWQAVVDDLELRFTEPYHQILDASDGPEWARWFVGGRLNLAQACSQRWAEEDPDRRAIVWQSEREERRELSYAQLDEMSARVAGALRALGVGSRDTVGIYMPMAPETVAALLACWRLGAIAVPIFSGFGIDAVARRLSDAEAIVLITADGFPRRGAEVAMKEIADEARRRTTSLRHVLCWQRLRRAETPWDADHDTDWDEALSAAEPVPTLPLPSGHPALLIYTSGSTGRPKGAVLTHAGLLVNVAKDGSYHVDVSPDDLLCWVTDIGWIMGAWEIIAAGVRGAAVCLIEGAPAAPRPDRVWSLVAEEGITVLGVSPSLVRGLAAAGASPRESSDCASLRILGATGEPWSEDAYLWLLENVGFGRCPIINISGGSEVGGCFLAPLPIEELKTCSLGGPALGMDVAVYDPVGRPLGPGEVGELVCRQPWPGMTQGLWQERERYLNTYWRRFPEVWVHGDWASFDESGQWYLHGRSDDTLNIGGQRLGPAEVEGVLTSQDGVAEAAAVAVPHEIKGQALWCFVIGSDEGPSGDELADAVASRLGKPFRPERIVFVRDLPRTRSAKILRRVIRAVALGEEPGDLSSIEDPAAIAAVRDAVGAVSA